MAADAPAASPYPRRWAALLAVVMSLLFGLPHLLLWAQLHAQGKPYFPLVTEHVQALTWDETTGYAPRFRDAYDGHPFTSDPAGWEHKAEAGFLGAGTLEPLLAWPFLKLLRGNTGALFALADFLLPPLLFLLLLWLGRRLELPFWVAAAAGFLLLLAHDQIELPFRLLAHPTWDNLSGQLSLTRAFRPVEYARYPVPQSAYACLLLAVIAVHALAQRPRLLTGVLAALALGALFYVYVFFWTWTLAGSALYALWLLLSRRRAAGLAVLGAIAGGCLLGLPVLYQLFTGFPGKEILQVRQGWGGRQVNFAHHKYELGVWVVFLAMAPWRDRRFPFLLSFLLAAYACLFGARMVGMNVQEWHWFGRCWYPWMSLCLVYAFAAWALRRPRREARLTAAMVALLLLCVAFGLNLHLRYGLSMARWHTVPPGEAAAYQWLREYAAPDSVVAAADCNVLALVPVYTQCNSYLPFCLTTPAPDQELVEKFCATALLLQLNGATVDRFLAPEQFVDDFWYPHRWWMVNWLYHTQFRDLTLPEPVRQEIWQVLHRLEREDPAAVLSRYRLDYLWVDETLRKQAGWLDGRPELEQVFTQEGVTLYRVHAGRAHRYLSRSLQLPQGGHQQHADRRE